MSDIAHATHHFVARTLETLWLAIRYGVRAYIHALGPGIFKAVGWGGCMYMLLFAAYLAASLR